MAKIVYILGAGASAQAIPPVSSLKLRMSFFIFYLRVIIERHPSDKNGLEEKMNHRLRVYSDIVEDSKNHISIDTLAKKLFLKDGIDDTVALLHLKELLCLYFLFEHYKIQNYQPYLEKFIEDWEYESEEHKQEIYLQLLKYQKNTIDFRYDALIAGISNKNIRNNLFLPPNVSVVSWNYDLQLEFALDYYDVFRSRNLNYMFNPFGWAETEVKFEFDREFIKLNGSAGYCLYNEEDLDMNTIGQATCKAKIEPLKIPSNRNEEASNFLIDSMISFVESRNVNKYRPYINFSWEDNQLSKMTVSRALDKISEADSIVIIGYSFPTFNREIDEILFSKIDLGSGGCKIYIQTIDEKEFVKIRTRIQGISHYLNDVDFEFIDDISQFYIPFEFSRDVEKRGIIKSM